MKIHRTLLVLLFVIIVFYDVFSPFSSIAGLKNENGTYIIENIIGTATVNNRKKSAVRDEAKYSACKIAAEKLLTELFPAIKKNEAVYNKIAAKLSGLVKNFQIDTEQLTDKGVMNITGTYKISETSLEKLIAPDIIKTIDNPRIMIFIHEKWGSKSSSITSKRAAQIFAKAGYTVVNPDQARPIIDIDPNKAFDNPATLYELARTLRADVILTGRANAGVFATKKYLGASFYGVSGSVQLKAVITRTSQEISSQTFSSSTGRKPAGSPGEGASRCLNSATDRAANQILNKVTYSIAFAGMNRNDITINIKIANILFNDVEKIERQLKELAGEEGEMFERSYKNNLLEIVFTSRHSSRETAQFLSDHGFTVKSLTNWSIDADMFSEQQQAPVQISKINVSIANVPSFKKSGEIENLLSRFVNSLTLSKGNVTAKYQDKTLELLVSFPAGSVQDDFAKKIASFLEENMIEIEGASQSFVSGKLQQEEEKRGGLLW